MEEKKTTPLRQRMIEDMNIRGFCEKTQKAHIRNVKHFASFLGRSPDTATPEDLRSYQLKMTEDGVTASTFNVRIISLRFFFGVPRSRRRNQPVAMTEPKTPASGGPKVGSSAPTCRLSS